MQARAVMSRPTPSRATLQRHRAPVKALARVPLRPRASAAVDTVTLPKQAIALTGKALEHLKHLRANHGSGGNEALLLRVGIKQGGCSGLSYTMDFEQAANVGPDDHVMDYDNGSFRLVTDPKSLLYLFGMKLDYSDALIGGGFQFQNPNATESCGCGKSFGV